MELTLQVHWGNEWHNAGVIRFHAPNKGLTGKPSFLYDTAYTVKALENLGDFNSENLIDKTSVGVNLPCHFGGDYLNGEVAPVLRDIIPQGASRRLWVKMMGYDRDPEQALDTTLLAEGCIAPIGNLRIKEAAEKFADRLTNSPPGLFTREEVCRRADTLIEHAYQLGIAIGGATGAGGDAPKLLMVETHNGEFGFEGAVPEKDIKEHWLVKFPRGRKTLADINVLKGEAAIYKTLEARGFNSIRNTHLDEADGQYTLWMARFDRQIKQGVVTRNGVESIYSMMGKIGDGAALNHSEILDRLTKVTTVPELKDELVADYIARDILNFAIGNKDNHGRNTAILKTGRDIALAPAFDVAPMVLDPEGIARTTRWPEALQMTSGVPDYLRIIDTHAGDPELAASILEEHLLKLTNLRDDLVENGAPESMIKAPGVNLTLAETILVELNALREKGAAPR